MIQVRRYSGQVDRSDAWWDGYPDRFTWEGVYAYREMGCGMCLWKVIFMYLAL